MSQYYQPRRTRNLYNPKATEPFSLSRSKIDLFIECQLCFYVDRRLGVGRPPGFPFALNSAVDTLLKKEFDVYRASKTAHPLMTDFGLKAIPYQHPDLDIWRENFKGVQTLHEKTNLRITGAVDDIWQDEDGSLIVVDYKSTSKEGQVSLDAEWQNGYKRQMEIYQWLLQQNGFKVSSTGYFVYCNGDTNKPGFDGMLEFDITVIPYTGNNKWIDDILSQIKECLDSDTLPRSSTKCDYCAYRQAAGEEIRTAYRKTHPIKPELKLDLK